MFRVLPLIAAGGLLALTACGSGEDAASDTVASVEPSADADTASADTSSDTSDTFPATVPATAPETVPATTPSPTTPASQPASGDAECLNGEWLADAAAIQATVDALGMPMTITVGPDSQWTASIHDGNYSLTSSVAVTAVIPNGSGMTLDATSTAAMEGTYTVEGNVVQATTISESSDMGDWTATINGVAIDFPLDGIADPPAVSAPGFNGSAFTCSDTTLQFDVIGASIPTLTYTRVG